MLTNVIYQIQMCSLICICHFSLVTQSCLTLCDPMEFSTPGFPVHHQFSEVTQAHVHQVRDDIQPSYPLLSPSAPTLNFSQHQGLFQRVSSLHQVAKVYGYEYLLYFSWPLLEK